MVGFNTTFFEKFLSQPYISEVDKDRLRNGLVQFRAEKYDLDNNMGDILN